MGVRQLQTFIQKSVPNGYHDISLVEECERYKKENGHLPILIIDLMGMLNPAIKCDKELLCGLRHNIIYKQIEALLQKLSSHAELIFFEDGPVNQVKLSEWTRRQNEQYDTCLRIFDKIYQNLPLEQIISSEGNLPSVTTHLKIVEVLAKKYGRLIKSVHKECDAEMARFACNDKKVLAILAEDSDFLIYPGQWRYFSLRQLNEDTLMTKEYNRASLRQFLQLNDEELVLLSTLNGNDVIHFNDTYHFRKHLHQQQHDACLRFPAIANYIKTSRLMESRNLYKDVAIVIYGRGSRNFIERIQESFEFYDVNYLIPEIKDDFLLYCRENGLDFTFSILNFMTKTFSERYYDLRQSTKYIEAKNKLFSKQIGILFKHNPIRSYTVYSKMSHQAPFHHIEIPPTAPVINFPSTYQIINRNDFPQHDNIRFSLLKWLINEEKLKLVDFEAIPIVFLVDILVLSFMVFEELITIEEADIILLTVKHVVTNTVPENILAPSIVHPQAFAISFLFSKSVNLIGRCLQLIGLTTLNKPPDFDGVLFHNLYLKYANDPSKILLLLGDMKNYRHYA